MIDARDLNEDGVELRAVQKVLATWFETHNLLPIPSGDGWWSLYADGRVFEDFGDVAFPFPTYHEMLADLLRRVDDTKWDEQIKAAPEMPPMPPSLVAQQPIPVDLIPHEPLGEVDSRRIHAQMWNDLDAIAVHWTANTVAAVRSINSQAEASDT